MFTQDSAEPAEHFLSRHLGNAQRQIASIPADSIGKNIQSLAQQYIDQMVIKPVELEKSVAKIDADKPNVVTVTWGVKGTIALIGLADSYGKAIDLKTNAQNVIRQELKYQSAIAGNESLQGQIKQEITNLTASLTAHIIDLNSSVATINRELRSEIPKFVEERVKFVNRSRAAEDFLNS